jgi:hydroxymethylbilane synthase
LQDGSIRLGTRGSALALAQAESVATLLRRQGHDVELVPIATDRDRRQASDKTRFVAAIEDALLRGDVDLAVHSAKDVPGTLPDGLALVAAPPAEDARDALVGAQALEALAEGARVGTASLRRRSQLLAFRPDLRVSPLRGNVDTRLARLADGHYDAIVLALAGLRRLGREREVGASFDVQEIVPAPGQGILALEARVADRVVSAVEPLNDRQALARLAAERALVATLDTSCHTPVGAHARLEGEVLRLRAYVGLPDGSEWIRDELAGDASEAGAVGEALAARMVSAGAGELLRRAEESIAA